MPTNIFHQSRHFLFNNLTNILKKIKV
jgi:hypothetical protein